MHHLVIVESPTKAKTIRKFLGKDYTILASMGHVRDLPQSSADVPAELKKTPKGQLGVDVDHNFDPLYLVPSGKQKTITELKKALKEADDLYLATDDDREGESISWHLLDILKPKVPVKRMVFHEITKPAIEDALSHPRVINENLVHAQETRRILDRLVGYCISPLLWKKIAYGLSAGRVQSATLKALVDRERARMAFTKAGYWDVTASLKKAAHSFEARLVTTTGKKIATGKDFDEETGQLKNPREIVALTEEEAKKIAETVHHETWTVKSVTKKAVSRSPAAPFITSTLQQEGNRKLGLSSKETMRAAQALYEQGYITYMRTDSFNLSQEALTGIRHTIEKRFGAASLHPTLRHYATTKGAQEAHEAIRPSLAFAAPDETPLHGIERDLYELIWMRTLASQMTNSEQEQVAATFQVKEHTFVANGTVILAPGFLRAYAEGSDDPDQSLADKDRPLPPLQESETVLCENTEALSHETKPPTRFSEASLIQYMEREGIGRPSTYASIVSTLLDRGYIRKQNNTLVATFTGMIVTQYMEAHFPAFVDVGFTSTMEKELDHIAEGTQAWLPYLQAFYFGDQGLKKRIEEQLKSPLSEEVKRLHLPNVPGLDVRLGKYGTYVEGIHPTHHTPVKATIPDTLAPSDVTPESIGEILSTVQQGPTSLGLDPATGKFIYLRTGSFGPYLQLGEEEEESKKKPKRVSIPKDIPLTELSYEKAQQLLSLPRELGVHPTDGKPVKVGLGRFGPYVVHEGEFRSLKSEDSLFAIELPRALELLAQPKGTRGAAVLKQLGVHPTDGKPITLHKGKFGTYVKHDKTNATLSKDLTEDTVTLEQALALLAERGDKKSLTKKRSSTTIK